jgi:hypothetical protein
MNILTNFLRVTAAMLVLAGWCADVYAAAAGQIQFVSGVAQLTTTDGKIRTLKKGDAVNEGDTLSTAPAAALQVKMRDGGIVAMRPESRVRIDSFKFNDREDGTEQSTFSLAKGGFRAITGLIGRINKQNYRVTTPTATIGIRGTDHEIFVVAPGGPLATAAPAGTYNKVNTGETVLSNDKGEVFIKPNQMGFAAAGQAPQLQPLNLNIFTVVPAPQAGAKQGEKIRNNTVVDGVVQVPGYVSGFMLPPLLTLTPTPITATYPCIVMSPIGQPIPGTCTATY